MSKTALARFFTKINTHAAWQKQVEAKPGYEFTNQKCEEIFGADSELDDEAMQTVSGGLLRSPKGNW